MRIVLVTGMLAVVVSAFGEVQAGWGNEEARGANELAQKAGVDQQAANEDQARANKMQNEINALDLSEKNAERSALFSLQVVQHGQEDLLSVDESTTFVFSNRSPRDNVYDVQLVLEQDLRVQDGEGEFAGDVRFSLPGTSAGLHREDVHPADRLQPSPGTRLVGRSDAVGS